MRSPCRPCGGLAAGCGSGRRRHRGRRGARGSRRRALRDAARVRLRGQRRPEMIDPVLEANPDLKIETATFDSNEEAAAKLAGGFEADVVEICADEMTPLLDAGPAAPDRPEGDHGLGLALVHQRRGDRDRRQDVRRAALGRPRGPDLQLRAGAGGNRRARRPLGSAVRRARDDPGLLRAAADRRGGARARDRGPVHDGRRAARADEAVPDRQQGPVPVALGLGLRSRQPLQVGRGRGRHRRASAGAADARRRGAGQVEPGRGGDAVLGVRLRAHLEGAEHGRRLRADELPVVAGGAGDPGRGRLPGHEPEGDRPGAARLRGGVRGRDADEAIPETYPADYQDWVRAFQDFKAQ